MKPGAIARTLVAAAGALALLALPLLPPEHLHRGHAAGGEHVELVHRHLEPHHPIAAGAGVDHPDADAAEWIDLVYAAPEASRYAPASPFVIAERAAPRLPSPGRRTLSSDHESVHDPPWARVHPPRGPPPSAVA